MHDRKYSLSRILDVALTQLMKKEESERAPTPEEVAAYLEEIHAAAK
jgi:hypothetical protein